MPNKKNQRNGFYYFMKDMLEETRGKGQNYTMGNIAEVAHPKWKVLPQEERDYYNDMAKRLKKEAQGMRLNCQGERLQEVLEETAQKEKEVHDKMQYIRSKVKKLGTVDAVKQEKFYVIAANIFSKTHEGDYIPAEIAVAEFSVLHGISNTYHQFINPGTIPSGYTYACHQHSEDTHKIPVSGFELASNNYMYIWTRIKEFVGNPKQKMYPVFCMPDEIEQMEGVLDWFVEKTGNKDDQLIRVLDLSVLLVELQLFACDHLGGTAIDSHAVARDILMKNTFDYVPNISCPWHEEQDVSNYCSLGIAKRYCYLMADNLCQRYDVEMVPKKHLPLKDAEAETTVYAPSSFQRVHKSEESFKTEWPKKSNQNLPSSIVKIRSKYLEDDDEDKVFIPGSTAGVCTEIVEDRHKAASHSSATRFGPSQKAPTFSNIIRGEEAPLELNDEDSFPSLASLSIGRGRGRGMSFASAVQQKPQQPTTNAWGRGMMFQKPPT